MQIAESAEGSPGDLSPRYNSMSSAVRAAAREYNIRSDYPGEIENIFCTLIRINYPQLANEYFVE